MSLDHADGGCTGTWRQVPGLYAGSAHIKCTKCRKWYEHTPELKLEAINNNYAGIYLCRLTEEGGDVELAPWTEGGPT